MKYRKFQATHLFTGQELLSGNPVLLTSEEGVILDIIPASEAGGDLEKLEGVLCPGFVNCHCHLELSHLKGRIPEKTGLVDFVYSIVTQRKESESNIAEAIALAETEMRENGIVAVGDICNTIFTLPQKEKQNLFYYNFIEVTGWNPDMAAVRFGNSLDNLRKYEQALPKMPLSMAPHAPYSVSEPLWELIKPFFRALTTSIHNQETSFEDRFFETGEGDFQRMYQLMNIDNSRFRPTGKSSLQSYIDKLLTAANLLLVHNTFITETDILFCETLRDRLSIYFCLCVNANLYIEDRLPPIESLRQHSSAIVLGTDSLASNHSLKLLEEMKTIQKHFPAIQLEEMLRWATYNGSEALGIEKNFGSFEKGKQPGIVLIHELNNLQLSARSVASRIL